MKLSLSRLTIFFAAIFLVSTSLCGLSFKHVIGGSPLPFHLPEFSVGLATIGMLVSALGLLGTGLGWLIMALHSRSRTPPSILPADAPEHRNSSTREKLP